MKITRRFLLATCLFSMIITIQSLGAQTVPVQEYNLGKGNLALDGYDPVAYFLDGKALKGSPSFVASYRGVVYRFRNQAHKEAFLKGAEQYLPQYGGWCAFAMGKTGEKVEVDPETYKIVDGKLYVFYNAYFNNTITSWNKDEHALKAKADDNWRRFRQSK
ncbi:MAG: tat pathway signal sequence domain protein [Saprospiraceae bacterium]|nr:tat pathway signal sequence domain protein [Saprospiraceae bacterium]